MCINDLRLIRSSWGQPVNVVGVCEARAADSAVGEAVLRVDEKMPTERARRTQGSPTHRAHIALGVAHHSRVLVKTADQDKTQECIFSLNISVVKQHGINSEGIYFLIIGMQNQRSPSSSVLQQLIPLTTSYNVYKSCLISRSRG